MNDFENDLSLKVIDYIAKFVLKLSVLKHRLLNLHISFVFQHTFTFFRSSFPTTEIKLL